MRGVFIVERRDREREREEITNFNNGVNHVAFGDALTP